MRGEARVVVGDLLAQILFLDFEQRLGIRTFHPRDKQPDKTAEQIGDAFEHNAFDAIGSPRTEQGLAVKPFPTREKPRKSRNRQKGEFCFAPIAYFVVQSSFGYC